MDCKIKAPAAAGRMWLSRLEIFVALADRLRWRFTRILKQIQSFQRRRRPRYPDAMTTPRR